MNNGLYDYHTYRPKDQEAFARNIEELNIDAIKLPSKDFDVDQVIHVWKEFDQKTKYLKNALYVIPFTIVPLMFSTAVMACTAVIVTAIAVTALGFHRSYQAAVQARIWPEVNKTIHETKRKLLELYVKQEFAKCTQYLAALNRDNAEEFIAAFFNEEKNPLVKTQSQSAIIRATEQVFCFYPRLKVDYNNFIKHEIDSLTVEQIMQNIEIFIKAYTAKDATELKKAFPDVKEHFQILMFLFQIKMDVI